MLARIFANSPAALDASMAAAQASISAAQEAFRLDEAFATMHGSPDEVCEGALRASLASLEAATAAVTATRAALDAASNLRAAAHGAGANES